MPGRRLKNVAANILSVLVVAGLIAVVAAQIGKREFQGPGPLSHEVTVVLPKGASLEEAATLLAAKGAIGNATLFRIGARYSGAARRIRYGEYRIPARASMADILDLFVNGRTVQHEITVPEGLTSWQVVELLKADRFLTGEVREVPPEGTLAPDTWFFERGETREGLLKRMAEAQKKILEDAWAQRIPGLPLKSAEEALILASIVEKETAIAAERPRVASVFLNRLRRGMRLQSDPTVVYGITRGRGSLGRGLKRSELDRPTPWNTYLIDGLPPTPIANPGRESIMAVVHPEDTDFLYFVADGSGGHVFATTLAEHNRNVAKWRALQRSKNN